MVVSVSVYLTVHYERQGSDLDSYPDVNRNDVYIVAYGVDGITDHVDSEVYDRHQAYEI